MDTHIHSGTSITRIHIRAVFLWFCVWTRTTITTMMLTMTANGNSTHTHTSNTSIRNNVRTMIHDTGTYFNCIMFMVASSVVLTVVVLNYHHRTADIHEMPPYVNWIQINVSLKCFLFSLDPHIQSPTLSPFVLFSQYFSRIILLQ